MSERAQISIGDLVRAVGHLGVEDPGTISAMAELLGLSDAEVRAVDTSMVSPPDDQPEIVPPDTERPRRSAPVQSVPRSGDVPPEEISAEPRRTVLTRLRHPDTEPRPPVKVEDIEDLLELSPEASRSRREDPRLLTPRWERAILSTALSIPEPEGAIDAERLVRRIARGQAVTSIPRRMVPTVRRGARLLVDLGRGMRPFARDARLLRKSIEKVIGPDGLEILRFSGNPLDGTGPGPRPTWCDYEPPAPGIPILLLTDLGIGGGPSGHSWSANREWLRFLSLRGHQSRPILALVPYPADRWPANLAHRMTILPWDRAANVSLVTKAIEASGRRGP